MRFIYSFLIIVFLSACASMHSKNDSLLAPSSITFSVLDSVLQMPPSIIPNLIEGITDNSFTYVGFPYVYSSYIGKEYLFLSYNRRGIINAFLVDFYLSKDSNSIKGSKERNEDNDGCTEAIPEHVWDYYAVYSMSIIAKLNNNGDIIYSPLSNKDLREIQRQYKRFWKENKDYPLEVIRKRFMESGGILTSPFIWL